MDKIMEVKPRRLASGKLVIASHNDGKVKEINELISPYGALAVPAKSLGLAEPEETGKSFAENAALKAAAAAKAAGLPALADDSGLEVTALGGAPGVYSARWAGASRDFSEAMARIEKELRKSGDNDRAARFVCALCLAWPDGHKEIFEGEIRGKIVFPPRGNKGFGYDPIFIPEGRDITFGQMAPEEKHAISHRAEAFRKLADACLRDQ